MNEAKPSLKFRWTMSTFAKASVDEKGKHSLQLYLDTKPLTHNPAPELRAYHYLYNSSPLGYKSLFIPLHIIPSQKPTPHKSLCSIP
jgi:hypothetical protein